MTRKEKFIPTPKTEDDRFKGKGGGGSINDQATSTVTQNLNYLSTERLPTGRDEIRDIHPATSAVIQDLTSELKVKELGKVILIPLVPLVLCDMGPTWYYVH